MDAAPAVLVVGATGATGKRLVEQLIDRGCHVKAVVRSMDRVPAESRAHERLTLVEATLLDLADSELVELVSGCDAIASCLGHNLSLRGVFGPPFRLVTQATRRLCNAVKSSGRSDRVKFVLMNTTGNRNGDLQEPISIAQHLVLFLIRCLVPPHSDNERAAEHLRVKIGQEDAAIEWVVVRPDGLIDRDEVTAYELHPSPIRSAIFDAGKTSRINVAHFMAELITEDETWKEWAGRMPVIYDVDPESV